jgi:hypothetical protein
VIRASPRSQDDNFGDLVKRTLGVRAGQIKRLVVKPGETAGVDEVTVILTRVASQDTQAFAEKLQSLSNVNQVSIVTRRDDHALLDAMWGLVSERTRYKQLVAG